MVIKNITYIWKWSVC